MVRRLSYHSLYSTACRRRGIVSFWTASLRIESAAGTVAIGATSGIAPGELPNIAAASTAWSTIMSVASEWRCRHRASCGIREHDSDHGGRAPKKDTRPGEPPDT